MTPRDLGLPLVCAGLLAWAAPPAPQDAPTVQPDWPPPYEFVHEDEHDDLERNLAALPFSRIELERTTCYGSCPAYTVTIERDGKALYVGREWAPREGTFTGDVSPFDFGRLCLLIERSGFTKMATEYLRPVTDSASAYVRVWPTDASEAIVVRDYDDFGPVELWMLQEAIDGVVSKMTWTRVRPTNDPPDHRKQHGIRPDEGFVPDAESATQIALAVWKPIYGQVTVGAQAPAALSDDGVWTVKGMLPDGSVGGVVVAEISKDNGQILRVSHGT